MKKILIILDGADDFPYPELGNKTPFEAAATPNHDFLSSIGRTGIFQTFKDGTIPGSENAILALLGYPIETYRSVGRAPFEALGLGIHLNDSHSAMRCNIVELNHDGTILTDRPKAIDSAIVKNQFLDTFSALKKIGYTFHRLSNFKAVTVSKNAFYGHICIPPHEADLNSTKKWQILPPDTDKNSELKKLKDIASRIIEINDGFIARYFGLWVWGGGKLPKLPFFSEISGYREPVVITGTTLVRGIARTVNMEIAETPEATGDLSTNYENKAYTAVKSLSQGADFVLIHIESPDEAGHSGDHLLKKRIFEDIDRRFLGTLLNELSRCKIDSEITITADHPTPCRLRRHTSAPVTTLTAQLFY